MMHDSRQISWLESCNLEPKPPAEHLSPSPTVSGGAESQGNASAQPRRGCEDGRAARRLASPEHRARVSGRDGDALSARKLAATGRAGKRGRDKRADQEQRAKIGELRELKLQRKWKHTIAAATSLGNTQNTPAAKNSRRPVTPPRILDPAGFDLAVERYRDQPVPAWELEQWRNAAVLAETREADTLTARAWKLRDLARHIHPSVRGAACGHRQVGQVGLMRRADGKHTFTGIETCASVWHCPVCALKIKRGRSEQIKEGVRLHREKHGGDSLLMMTLTVRHKAGQDLRTIRDGFQAAHDGFWKRVSSQEKNKRYWAQVEGKEFVPWREELGFIGYLSGTELTHGANGWHLHRHYILAFERELSQEETSVLGEMLSSHWRAQVYREMGPEFRPTIERGLDLRMLRVADYLSKLGLEISDVGNKEAKNGNQTQWGLALEASRGNGLALDAWAEFVQAMKGSKCVQFSNALLEHWTELGLEVVDDAELADDTQGAVLVYELENELWRKLRAMGRVRSFLDYVDEHGPPPGGASQPTVEREGMWPPEKRCKKAARLERKKAETFYFQSIALLLWDQS